MFNSKIKLFVAGRKKTFTLLNQLFPSNREVIWMHVASLGEYEQGLPVLEALKQEHPEYTIALTFFSPSGFEVKKDKTPADIVVYLPMDTVKNSQLFLDTIRPKIAIFIKYEIWPNYLFELKKRSIPTFLVSGIFSRKQIFFRSFGGFMRNALESFTHFFVQETTSKQLLESIGISNVTVSGDTRFDRVYAILKQENSLDFMGQFKGQSKCLVAGSTWPEDEEVILEVINATEFDLKVLIAPHNIKPRHIATLKSSITKRTVLYSERQRAILPDTQVLIIDTVGLLTKIYSYADLAYVGGGFATGLHNTLEPAVFGIPVIIGPKYKGFNEAIEMVAKKGLISVSNKKEFETVINQLMMDATFLQQTGQNNAKYISEKVGATQKVLKHLKPLL